MKNKIKGEILEEVIYGIIIALFIAAFVYTMMIIGSVEGDGHFQAYEKCKDLDSKLKRFESHYVNGSAWKLNVHHELDKVECDPIEPPNWTWEAENA